MSLGGNYNGLGPHLTTHVQASWFHVVATDRESVSVAVGMVERETGLTADVRTMVSTPWIWPGSSEIVLPFTNHS